ncbi:hypothetical protein MNBD_NITROSPIRAE01-2000 [hydrothermal vent metagenome]|uniref:Tetratricopeptide repeat protein n=1 Tax=hydrothermal vent metagenome TaxID=652676 RepID=A0A3B1CNG3_9ZZZZ
MVDKSRSAEISRLSDLLQNNPSSRLFVPLAEAYLQSDMFEEAIQVLRDGLSTHSSFVAARVMLGKIHLKTKQHLEAKEQFKEVIAIAPSNIPSLKGLAGIYQKEGLFAEAKTTYKTILKIDPGDKEATASLEEISKKRNEGTETQTSVPLPPAEQNSEFSTDENPREKALSPSALPSEIETSLPEITTKPLSEETSIKQTQEEAHSDLGPDEPRPLEPHENKTMAALYVTQGHYQEAADVYENLLKRNPEDHESQKGLEASLVHLRNNLKTPPSNTEKIERLQLWLEAIQGEKRR